MRDRGWMQGFICLQIADTEHMEQASDRDATQLKERRRGALHYTAQRDWRKTTSGICSSGGCGSDEYRSVRAPADEVVGLAQPHVAGLRRRPRGGGGGAEVEGAEGVVPAAEARLVLERLDGAHARRHHQRRRLRPAAADRHHDPTTPPPPPLAHGVAGRGAC